MLRVPLVVATVAVDADIDVFPDVSVDFDVDVDSDADADVELAVQIFNPGWNNYYQWTHVSEFSTASNWYIIIYLT